MSAHLSDEDRSTENLLVGQFFLCSLGVLRVGELDNSDIQLATSLWERQLTRIP